jgi:ribose transport system substrate-binding protein
MKEGAEAEAKANGYELLVQAPEKEYDVERQMQIMENMITNKVAAILLTPSGKTEIIPAVKLANNQGIPVIDIDEKIDPNELAAEGAHVETYIASDNYLGGQMAAELMIKLLGGSGKVAILEGVAGHEVSLARTGGFADGIKAKSNIQIVASQPANWEREQGFNVFQNILTANPDITGLFAASDLMALGAAEAIEQAGLKGKIMVIGFDANDEAKQAVRDGVMMGTVAQDPRLMGQIAVRSAIRILNGESIEANIPVNIVMVTKETL